MSSTSLHPAICAGEGSSGCDPRVVRIVVQKRFKTGETIYWQGDRRDVILRIDAGTVAVFRRHDGRPSNITRIAGPGDYIGLGCLDHHSETARAICEATLTCISLDEFARLAEADERLRTMQADADERDFRNRKDELTSAPRPTPERSVAALLSCISQLNVYEGRDPHVVGDSMTCGTVADLLDLDIDRLQRALVGLKAHGLIESTDDGAIRIVSLGDLGRFCDSEPKQAAEAPKFETAACALHFPRFGD